MLKYMIYSWINFQTKAHQFINAIDDNSLRIDANLPFEEKFSKILNSFEKSDKNLLAKKLRTLISFEDWNSIIDYGDYDRPEIDAQMLINKFENNINRKVTEEELFKLKVLLRIIESNLTTVSIS